MGNGPGFTNLFGGGPILPAFPLYLPLFLNQNTLLAWPTETNTGNGLVMPEILEVTANAPNLALQLSPATQVGVGYSALINNVGAISFTVQDNLGNTIATIASGTVWQIYLADNTTQQGTWRVFQFGAGVSQANAASLAGAGLKAIGSLLNARMFINAQTQNYPVANTDRASLVEWTGVGGGTITLPNPATVGSDWFCFVRNSGGAAITVNTAAGTLNGAASLVFNVNDSAIIVCDGVGFWTIGYGQQLTSSFTYITINLAGDSGNVVLAGSNLGKTSYKFTGALAGNVTVVVPASVAQYWVSNATTGTFTLTFASSGVGGSTYTLGQGNANILYCDGLNVVPAVSLNSGTPTFPDGTAAAPSITFASDLTAGLYKAGTDVLGFATAGLSRGTISAAGDWTFGAPTSGITLSVFGVANNTALELLSGNGAASPNPDLVVSRAGSTINQLAEGPSLQLIDSTNHNGATLQSAGGQIELWQQFNNGAWFQAAVWDTTGDLKIPANLNFGAGGAIEFEGTEALGITSATAPTVSDDGGIQQIIGFRGLPLHVIAADTVLTLADRGKMVAGNGAGGVTVTIPANVFQGGDAVSLMTWSQHAITIAEGAGFSLFWADGSTAGPSGRTLNPYGIATLIFFGATAGMISGSGLS